MSGSPCTGSPGEAVTNALRHARDVTHITVQVADESGHVRLTIRDNGDNATAHVPAAMESSA